MVSPAPGNPSINEPFTASEQTSEIRAKARGAGQQLRNFGFQAIALLLGIALAFM